MQEFSLSDISKIQTEVMRIVDLWGSKEKTPISRKYIISQLKKKKVGEPTIILAINTLMRKGYIRRAVVTSNKTYYVQLRRI